MTTAFGSLQPQFQPLVAVGWTIQATKISWAACDHMGPVLGGMDRAGSSRATCSMRQSAAVPNDGPPPMRGDEQRFQVGGHHIDFGIEHP